MNNEKTDINEEQALQIGSVMLRLFTEQEINSVIDAKEMNDKYPFITKSDEKTLENDRNLVCECLGIDVINVTILKRSAKQNERKEYEI